MSETLINLSQLVGNQNERLSGIKSWSNLEIIGKNNLERILQLAQENIYRMMSEHEDHQEMRKIKTSIDFINSELIPKSGDKPTLPKLRNEIFHQTDSI